MFLGELGYTPSFPPYSGFVFTFGSTPRYEFYPGFRTTIRAYRQGGMDFYLDEETQLPSSIILIKEREMDYNELGFPEVLTMNQRFFIEPMNFSYDLVGYLTHRNESSSFLRLIFHRPLLHHNEVLFIDAPTQAIDNPPLPHYHPTEYAPFGDPPPYQLRNPLPANFAYPVRRDILRLIRRQMQSINREQ